MGYSKKYSLLIHSPFPSGASSCVVVAIRMHPSFIWHLVWYLTFEGNHLCRRSLREIESTTSFEHGKLTASATWLDRTYRSNRSQILLQCLHEEIHLPTPCRPNPRTSTSQPTNVRSSLNRMEFRSRTHRTLRIPRTTDRPNNGSRGIKKTRRSTPKSVMYLCFNGTNDVRSKIPGVEP